MKDYSHIYIALVIFLLLVGNLVSWNRLAKLENYHRASEELLDTLENHYNWVDAIDDENYYKAVSDLE